MESAVRTLDKMGRISIPPKWRENLGKKVILIKMPNGEILIKPLRRIRLTELFDSIEIEEIKDFTDTHELRRVLYE